MCRKERKPSLSNSVVCLLEFTNESHYSTYLDYRTISSSESSIDGNSTYPCQSDTQLLHRRRRQNLDVQYFRLSIQEINGKLHTSLDKAIG